MHSDLAGSVAGLREIPIEGGDASSEQHKEEETAEQPRAPCLPGHGCFKRALLPHSDTSSRSPPSSLLNYSGEEPAGGAELALPQSPALCRLHPQSHQGGHCLILSFGRNPPEFVCNLECGTAPQQRWLPRPSLATDTSFLPSCYISSQSFPLRLKWSKKSHSSQRGCLASSSRGIP